MNDRIKELADKACRDTDLQPVNGGIHITPAFEKFADMLIVETLNVMQQEWYDLNNAPEVENESPRDIGIRVGKKGEVIALMHKIKEHFRVEK